MRGLRLLAAVALVPVLVAGCSSADSTAPATSATPSAVLPTGGEAEAFCGAVQELMTELQQLAAGEGDADMMGQLQEKAEALAVMAGKYQTDLARDPNELQKVQDCLSQLQGLN